MNNHEHYTYAMRCQKLGSHWQSKKRARESELSWSFVCRARVHDLHDAMCKCKRKNSDARPADLCSRAPSKQVEARRREQEIEIEREREREARKFNHPWRVREFFAATQLGIRSPRWPQVLSLNGDCTLSQSVLLGFTLAAQA